MSENYNIAAHYTNKPKVERPKRTIANGPGSLPNMHLYNDFDAKMRLREVDRDLYHSSQKEKRKPLNEFIKICGFSLLAILSIVGLKKLFKKS